HAARARCGARPSFSVTTRTIAMTPSQSAFVAQTKLLARYGSLYGIDQGVLDRIAAGAATDVTALMEGYAARGYDVQKKSLDAPYAGTSMPQYGGMVDGRDAYVDLVQEMSLTRPTVCKA